MNYKISYDSIVYEELKEIKDRRILSQLKKQLEKLETEPDKRGESLKGNLAGFRSLHCINNRYRIIFSVNLEQFTVNVHHIGLRKGKDRDDIYKQSG